MGGLLKRASWILIFAMLGCTEQVTIDPSMTGALSPPPTAEFDPANLVVPFPNNLILDPATGKVKVPAQCGESVLAGLLRTSGLNTLDGFGTSKLPITTTFTDDVDTASLDGRVVLVRRATAGVAADASEPPVPTVLTLSTGQRPSTDCTSTAPTHQLTIVPKVPLRGASTYTLALLSGIKTASGIDVQPAFTWGLVRQSRDPVEIAADGTTVTKNDTPLDPTKEADRLSLVGLDALWKAHATGLAFLDAALPGKTRRDILLAWEFNTESIGTAFDPTAPSTPASLLSTTSDAPTVTATIKGDAAITAAIESALGAATCQKLPCSEIAAIQSGTIVSPTFQQGATCNPAAPGSPGAFSDPIRPAKRCDNTIGYLAVVPKTGVGPAGFKTVVFGHGLGRSKEDLLAIGGQLAKAGIMSLAIDAVDHGARAIPLPGASCTTPGTDNACTSQISPSCAPQCFVPLLSPDLVTTRDNLRQTVLDNLKLERVLAHCAASGACQDGVWVDPAHIGYVGQSLGSILGSVTAAVSQTMKAAVLDVGAGDWVQIFTDTKSDGIRCPLVDGLIGIGVLKGQTWDLGAHADALCLSADGAWRTDPGFLQFAATARWILDPVDGENYVGTFKSGGRASALLQQVVGDEIVPNSATESYGALLGATYAAAAKADGTTPSPSPSAGSAGSQWIKYTSLPADAAAGFAGNAYAHASLLSPSGTGTDGLLGTLLLQTDALTFLATHL
jgi:hypothetical protein